MKRSLMFSAMAIGLFAWSQSLAEPKEVTVILTPENILVENNQQTLSLGSGATLVKEKNKYKRISEDCLVNRNNDPLVHKIGGGVEEGGDPKIIWTSSLETVVANQFTGAGAKVKAYTPAGVFGAHFDLKHNKHTRMSTSNQYKFYSQSVVRAPRGWHLQDIRINPQLLLSNYADLDPENKYQIPDPQNPNEKIWITPTKWKKDNNGTDFKQLFLKRCGEAVVVSIQERAWFLAEAREAEVSEDESTETNVEAGVSYNGYGVEAEADVTDENSEQKKSEFRKVHIEAHGSVIGSESEKDNIKDSLEALDAYWAAIDWDSPKTKAKPIQYFLMPFAQIINFPGDPGFIEKPEEMEMKNFALVLEWLRDMVANAYDSLFFKDEYAWGTRNDARAEYRKLVKELGDKWNGLLKELIEDATACIEEGNDCEKVGDWVTLYLELTDELGADGWLPEKKSFDCRSVRFLGTTLYPGPVQLSGDQTLALHKSGSGDTGIVGDQDHTISGVNSIFHPKDYNKYDRTGWRFAGGIRFIQNDMRRIGYSLDVNATEVYVDNQPRTNAEVGLPFNYKGKYSTYFENRNVTGDLIDLSFMQRESSNYESPLYEQYKDQECVYEKVDFGFAAEFWMGSFAAPTPNLFDMIGEDPPGHFLNCNSEACKKDRRDRKKHNVAAIKEAFYGPAGRLKLVHGAQFTARTFEGDQKREDAIKVQLGPDSPFSKGSLESFQCTPKPPQTAIPGEMRCHDFEIKEFDLKLVNTLDLETDLELGARLAGIRKYLGKKTTMKFVKYTGKKKQGWKSAGLGKPSAKRGPTLAERRGMQRKAREKALAAVSAKARAGVWTAEDYTYYVECESLKRAGKKCPLPPSKGGPPVKITFTRTAKAQGKNQKSVKPGFGPSSQGRGVKKAVRTIPIVRYYKGKTRDVAEALHSGQHKQLKKQRYRKVGTLGHAFASHNDGLNFLSNLTGKTMTKGSVVRLGLYTHKSGATKKAEYFSSIDPGYRKRYPHTGKDVWLIQAVVGQNTPELKGKVSAVYRYYLKKTGDNQLAVSKGDHTSAQKGGYCLVCPKAKRGHSKVCGTSKIKRAIKQRKCAQGFVSRRP